MTTPTANNHASTPSLDVTPIASTIQRVEAQLDELESLASTLQALADLDAPAIPAPSFPLPENFMLSIVIPVYNERETLYSLLSQVAQLPFRRQIILVDDCSTDGTRELLKEIQGAADVTVLYHLENQGKGAALRTGFGAAKGDVVVIQDADLEYHPQDIPALLGPLVSGEADVVYGSRFLADSQDPSKVHRFGNWLLTASSNLFTGLRLTDMETCYKAFRTEWLQKVSLCQDRFGFEPEVTAKLARRGCRISEVPIGYQARSYEEGKKIGIKDLFNAFYCIIRYGLRD
jgi:glycosyltransferase involved in cell wall biosynthesis